MTLPNQHFNDQETSMLGNMAIKRESLKTIITSTFHFNPYFVTISLVIFNFPQLYHINNLKQITTMIRLISNIDTYTFNPSQTTLYNIITKIFYHV